MHRLVLLLALASGFAVAAPGKRTLQVFMLPARNAAGLDAQVQTLRKQAAEALSATMTEARPESFEQNLSRASDLAFSGNLDEAATLLDQVIVQARKRPFAITRVDDYVAAVVRRAAIATSRGETHLAAELLAGLRDDDALFELTPAERSPQLLEMVRALAATRPLDNTLVGDSCQAADIVLIGRRVRADAVEWARFDKCQPVANRFLTTQEVAQGVGLEWLRPVSTAVKKPAYKRPWVWGVVAASVVVVGVSLGVGLGVGLNSLPQTTLPPWRP
jgi:hypothetical protein